MTVASANVRITTTGNGTTTSFSYPYYVIAAADLKVYVNGALQTLTTHYTLSGTAPYTNGTNVQFVTAPATGLQIILVRDPPQTQLTAYVENDPFPVATVEQALDKLTMLAHTTRDTGSRALRLSQFDSRDGANFELSAPANWTNKYLLFDANGNPTPAVLSATTITPAIIGGLLNQQTSAELAVGVTPTFTIYAPTPAYDLRRICALDGVTDDRAALNSVFSVITQYGGGEIRHAPGTLRLASAPNALPANLTWHGVGREVSLVKVDGAFVGLSKVFPNHSQINAMNLWMRNVGIIGTATALGAVELGACDWIHLEHCGFEDFTATNAYGVNIASTLRWAITHSHFENIKAKGLTAGILYGIGCNHGAFSRNEVIGNNQAAFIGMSLDTAQNIEIAGNDIEGSTNGLHGIDLIACEGVHIHDNYIELWTGQAIRAITGAATRRVLIEQNALNSTGPVIRLDNATPNERITVRRNRFIDMAAGVDGIVPGATVRFEEYDNDPASGDTTDTYTTSNLTATGVLSTATGTLTGCTTSPTATLRFEKINKTVTLHIPALTATSNTNACTITGGIPTRITPARDQPVACRYMDNGVTAWGVAVIGTTGTITLFNEAGSSTFFTTSGTKGVPAGTLVFSLD